MKLGCCALNGINDTSFALPLAPLSLLTLLLTMSILLSLQSPAHKIPVNMQSRRKSPALNSINVEGALGFVVEQPPWHVTPQPTRTPSGNILCSVSEVPALVKLDESEGLGDEVLGQIIASSPITAKYIFNS
jgi:hypothetical protein